MIEEVGKSSSSESESAQIELRAVRAVIFSNCTPAQVLAHYRINRKHANSTRQNACCRRRGNWGRGWLRDTVSRTQVARADGATLVSS